MGVKGAAPLGVLPGPRSAADAPPAPAVVSSRARLSLGAPARQDRSRRLLAAQPCGAGARGVSSPGRARTIYTSPFPAARTEYALRAARTAGRGAALRPGGSSSQVSPARPAPAAGIAEDLPLGSFPPLGANPLARFARGAAGGLAVPPACLRPEYGAFALPVEPRSDAALALLAVAPARPRQRLRGPGARPSYTTALAALACSGGIVEAFLPIDRGGHCAAPAPLGPAWPIALPAFDGAVLEPRSQPVPPAMADLATLFDGDDRPLAHFQPDFRLLAPGGEFGAPGSVSGAFRALHRILGSLQTADVPSSFSGPWPLSRLSGAAHPPAAPLRAKSGAEPGVRPKDGLPEAPWAPAGLHFLLPRFGSHAEPGPKEQTFAQLPAGFASDAALLAAPGVLESSQAPAEFPLYPVWLPALFNLARLRAALQAARGFNPHSMETLDPHGDEFRTAEGPGFSGMLAFPPASEAEGDFPGRAEGPDSPAPPRGRHAGQRALQIWNGAPALARCLILAAPLLAPALLIRPGIALQAPSSHWGAIAAAIHERAAVDLREDFQSGLGAWTGRPGWEPAWSLDRSGAAQPGPLALYRPSLPLRDYRFEFQGSIGAKAMGFVFRAADTENYSAAKIAIKKPGPLPSVSLIRYAVIGGREEARTEIAIPLHLQQDTLYKMLVTVEGEHFSISINGQLVDAWSDTRLKSGGVGLFADKGEIAHVRGVHVLEHEDFLGWLCSQVSHWTADRRTIGVKHE